ncbi:hypothetical protein HRbin08_01516 [bacterium HR08]|nr:hypothetical protein HRbin08_01516 [bacterium HR08]
MSWRLYRCVWKLHSPLHVGTGPAGSLNRTRLYVLARTVWGALTAELARGQSGNFPDYQNIGRGLSQQCRFSYLFPAQQVDRHWRAWLPRYEEGHGLVWRREDCQNAGDGVPDRVFRSWLLTTRPGTAIDPGSDSAAEGTLREYEVINPWSRWGEKGELRPVALVGYVFLSDTAPQGILDITELFIGGDIRYGLGQVRRVECSNAGDLFGRAVRMTGSDPVVETHHVLAHALPAGATDLLGAMEQLAMWDYGRFMTGELTWAPGCQVRGDCASWRIREDGLWERAQEGDK